MDTQLTSTVMECTKFALGLSLAAKHTTWILLAENVNKSATVFVFFFLGLQLVLDKSKRNKHTDRYGKNVVSNTARIVNSWIFLLLLINCW